MDEEEIRRIRKAICRSFGSSPHKKKYWLALPDMFVAAQKEGQLFCSCGASDAVQSEGDKKRAADPKAGGEYRIM